AEAHASARRRREAADDELLPLLAADLAPRRRATALVGRVATFRDDPLDVVLARVPEERRALALDVLGVADDVARGRVAARRERRERLLAGHERQPTEVAAVQERQIEDDVGERAVRGERVLQRLEARAAVGLHDDDLAVE